MKQVLVKKGQALVAEVPEPEALAGFVLVALRASCVSPGTEMAGIANSGKSLMQRVIEQPDKAKAALERMRKEGIGKIWQQAKEKFESSSVSGYSAAGVVVDLGSGVDGFRRGMRVAVAGAGLANHAALVAVPVNLCVPVPDEVSFADASSVALGGIAMQAVRRAEVTLAEKVAVIGCGPLGLLAIQMLHASGCRVFATDLDERRLGLAKEFGAEQALSPAAEDVVKRAQHWSGGMGVDAAIVFSSTASGEPVSQAFRMSRRKGRVVLAGVAGGEYKRDEMYMKELDFLISTSYGPGRYDDDYELRGNDYPFAYVRWTENRNMAAYLELLSQKRVLVAPMIEVEVPVEEAASAYEKLKAPERPLLAVIHYDFEKEAEPPAEVVEAKWAGVEPGKPVGLALVGAGSFVRAMHVPILKGMSEQVRVPLVISRTGPSATACAETLPGSRATTDFPEALRDSGVHAVLIGTRHDTHAALAIQALHAGKAVFVEKPMCLTPAEFVDLEGAVKSNAAPFMVGYNRRFSPFARRIREEVADRIHPLMIRYTMNAGYLPPEHWTQGLEGGGRLLGEACHIIDLFRSLVGHPVVSLSCSPLRGANPAARGNDNFTLTLEYADGSVATLIYSALGHPDIPKERMEVFFDQKAFILDDYVSMSAHGLGGARINLKSADKGHQAEWGAFISAVASGERFPIPWEELVETWRVSWQADEICRTGASLLATP